MNDECAAAYAAEDAYLHGLAIAHQELRAEAAAAEGRPLAHPLCYGCAEFHDPELVTCDQVYQFLLADARLLRGAIG